MFRCSIDYQLTGFSGRACCTSHEKTCVLCPAFCEYCTFDCIMVFASQFALTTVSIFLWHFFSRFCSSACSCFVLFCFSRFYFVGSIFCGVFSILVSCVWFRRNFAVLLAPFLILNYVFGLLCILRRLYGLAWLARFTVRSMPVSRYGFHGFRCVFSMLVFRYGSHGLWCVLIAHFSTTVSPAFFCPWKRRGWARDIP